MGKIISIPIKNINFSETEDKYKLPVTLEICKEGFVPCHNLIIEKSAIEKASDTIVDVPLLCAYEIDEEGNKTDFKGHEMHYNIYKEGTTYIVNTIYDEQPVGHIPYNCNPVFNGEGWFTAEGYLYKLYCQDAVRILQENEGKKSVSMEIDVIKEEIDEKGITHILEFNFMGVTLLGETHTPAIEGANIKQFEIEQAKTFTKEYFGLINKIILKGGNKVKREEILEKYTHLSKLDKFEAITSNKELTDEQLEQKLFALSIIDLESRIREQLTSITYDYTYCWGEVEKCRKYWLRDLIFEDKIAILDDNETDFTYGVPFSIKNDSVILDFEAKIRYIRGDWRPFVEGEEEPVVNPLFEERQNKIIDKATKATSDSKEFEKELQTANEKIVELEKENVSTSKELERLTKFEKDINHAKEEKQLNEVIKEFSSLEKVEGFEAICDKKFELGEKELANQLKILSFDNGVVVNSKKKKNNKDEFIHTNLNFEGTELTEAQKRYGVNILNYLKK